MANAKQCDRCKKFYTRSYTPDLTVNRYYHAYGDTRYDLCDECIDALERFLLNAYVGQAKEVDENERNLVQG